MSAPDLLSIQIKDFRSINGQINVPLDAPIVLIHGVNGAGKSSVLSAIELALTGSAAGLAQGKASDTRHLVHRGCEKAEVSLRWNNGAADVATQIEVDANGAVSGEPALTRGDRRTFVERCYLSQSTVGRLLDIYQHSESGDSPLTRFVKDLLGLDKLESLIDGLFHAGDRRRLRSLIPLLADVESEEGRLRRRLALASDSAKTTAQATEELRHALLLALEGLQPSEGTGDMSGLPPARLIQTDFQSVENADITDSLEGLRQDLQALQKRAGSVASPEQSAFEDVEARVRAAEAARARWEQSHGAQLDRLFDQLRGRFLNLPVSDASFYDAAGPAQEQLASEIAQIDRILEEDRTATTEASDVSEQLAKTRERSARLSAALVAQPERVLDLSRLLAELISHVYGDVCPVCERNYAEVSSETLTDHMTERLAALSTEGKRLLAIVQSVQEAEADERRLSARLDQLKSRQLTTDSRLEHQRAQAQLSSMDRALQQLAPRITEGAQLRVELNESRRDLIRLRNSTTRTAEIRVAASALATELDAEPVGEAESIGHVLTRLTEHVEARLRALRAERAQASKVTSAKEALSIALADQEAADQELRSLRSQLKEYERALRAFDDRRTLARSLAAEAEAARSRVVRQVFNHSLNGIWRDLFIRLVPLEPFVPAFQIVERSGGRVAAELETRHRDGGIGGNPSYMLSAGNLNTGAVTLFLALHLSANPTLPWLILDDPVQSMDEVHIAQFAALLRTLSKQEGRKVVIAVHEKSLFDYLSLELSPAFEGDKLITVEISRPDDGPTQTIPQFVTWNDEPALIAG